MEHKIDKIITCEYNNKTITLKVTPIRDSTCSGCFFYQNYKSCCYNIKNVIGYCAKYNRKDKTSIIFKQITNKTMNEPIDLTKILKNCPEGTKLYSIVHGDVTFVRIDNDKIYPIIVTYKNGFSECFTSDGKMIVDCNGECTLFPSKEQRDWNKFTAPWQKKDKFDPKTLRPFDKVIARIDKYGFWCCELFSFIEEGTNLIKGCGAYYKYCVPYNDDTKHLVGTTEEAPEYYRYWEE